MQFCAVDRVSGWRNLPNIKLNGLLYFKSVARATFCGPKFKVLGPMSLINTGLWNRDFELI
jgi:hypothetical protein